MANRLSWLHISDIHFQRKTEWRASIARAALLDYLENMYGREDSARPDFIFCTGDIAYGENEPSAMHTQYADAEKFLKALCDISGRNGLPLPSNRLFAVPGNHDVNRKNINSFTQTALINCAKTSNDHYQNINQQFDERTLEFKDAIKRLDEYGDFIKRFLPHQYDPDGRYCHTNLVELNGLRIGIAGFNSSWSCAGLEDDRALWLAADWQFNSARVALKSADIRIGLIHHPIDWLNYSEQEIAKRRIPVDFDFWLHGHIHSPWVDPNQSLITIAAGAIGAETSEEFGINSVSLTLEKAKGTVDLHAYSPRTGGWTIQPVPVHAPNGRWSFDLPNDLRGRLKQHSARLRHERSSALIGQTQLSEQTIKSLSVGFLNSVAEMIEIAPNSELQRKATGLTNWLAVESAARSRKELLAALTGVILELSQHTTDEFASRLPNYLNRASGNSAVSQLLGATTLEMVRVDAQIVPKYLIAQIELPEIHHEYFARFLHILRRSLSIEHGYQAAISYANDLAGLDLLRGFAGRKAASLDYIRTIEANLAFECKYRGLSADYAKALDAYLLHLRERELPYSQLPLVRASRDVRTNIKEVFVPIEVRDKVIDKLPNEQKQELPKYRPKQGDVSVDQNASQFGTLILSEKRVALLGPPGGGKTTLMKCTALALAEGRARDIPGWTSSSGMIPIFLRLRGLAAYLTAHRSKFFEPCPGGIVAYVEHYYREARRVNFPSGFFDKLLEGGGCAVFMDGLDEVPLSQRQEVAQHVQEFITRYGATERENQKPLSIERRGDLRYNLFVLTSRPKGYDPVEPFLQKAACVVREVRPLERASIRQLIRNLLKCIEPDEDLRERDYEALGKAILGSGDLTILAGTPLFCTSLVLMYKYHGAELPQRRVDVFEEIVNLLLGFWEAQDQKLTQPLRLDEDDGLDAGYLDVIAAVDTRKKRLSHVALQMQFSEKRTEIDFVTLLEILSKYLIEEEEQSSGQAKIRAMRFISNSHERSGLLIETEPTNPAIYAFSHEGFREYLVAAALANLREAEFVSTILGNIDNPTWEEVIILAAAYRELPNGLRKYILERCAESSRSFKFAGDSDRWARRLIMAGRMARDMGERLSPRDRTRLQSILAEAVNDIGSGLKYRIEIALVLDELGWLTRTLFTFAPTSFSESSKFYIGKNLVANQQYRRFVEAPDYDDLEVWSYPHCFDSNGGSHSLHDGAIAWLSANTNDERLPKSWNDPKFGVAHRGLPVVGISWYEATAYCRWLQRHWYELEEARENPNMLPRKIRLPTESEWSEAALGRGPSVLFQRSNECKQEEVIKTLSHANIGKSLDRTSPVGMFASSSHPDCLNDICGNVWEWQANYFDRGYRAIALRGGAFTTAVEDGLTDLRGWREPIGRDNDIGFRILIET